MAADKVPSKKQSIESWFAARNPWPLFWEKNVTHYYLPRNLNFWYLFGAFSLVMFAIQIISGIWLVMEYVPTASGAFTSVEHIMREVHWGWLLRYMHTTGASVFFAVIYLHMYKSIMYGSYRAPRELVWLAGMIIYIILLMEAFTGYVLPWGQMSYWAATVITSFASSIPYFGDTILLWLRGDYNVGNVTLHRFFALHIIAIPLLLTIMIIVHLKALRRVGSNNPDGIDVNTKNELQSLSLDAIPFHPYYTVKDLLGVVVFLSVFCYILFFIPQFGGLFLEPTNYIPANPLQTPNEITSTWYMSPFYAMLRAIPYKLMGLLTIAAAIAIMFVLPWLDRSPVRSLRYKGLLSKIAMLAFIISFVGLGVIGHEPITPGRMILARIFIIIYFSFFLLMPIYSVLDKVKPLPKRVTD